MRGQLEKSGKVAAYDWPSWIARDSQLPPPGEWLLWLLSSGSGFGKTRTGSATPRMWVEGNATSNYALVGLVLHPDQTRDFGVVLGTIRMAAKP